MKRLFSIIAVTLSLGACDSSSNNVPAPTPLPTPGNAQVQVLHAVFDAPAVDVSLSGTSNASGGPLSGIDYKAGTGALSVQEGGYAIQVDALTPNGDVTVIDTSTNFVADTLYTVIAVGTTDGTLNGPGPSTPVIEPLVLSQPAAGPAAGNARLRVVHAAPAAPEVTVYATAPGAMLSGSAPVGTFEYKGDLGPIEVPAGDYQIRVTLPAPADPDTNVVYDAGTVALADGDDLVVAAVANTSGGAAPISLALLTGAGSAEILDAGTPTSFRAVHAAENVGPVDVIIDDQDAPPLVVGLTFPNFTGLVETPPATYNVKVSPTGTGAGGAVIDADLPLDAGQRYDIIAQNNPGITALVANDDPRPLATAAKVRLIHASPTAGTVDIWVTAPGPDLTTTAPTLVGIPVGANTGYLELAPGDYEVNIAPTTTTTAAITVQLTVAAGDILTAIAKDEVGGGAVSPTPILIDDTP